jgi:hypothetical protein
VESVKGAVRTVARGAVKHRERVRAVRVRRARSEPRRRRCRLVQTRSQVTSARSLRCGQGGLQRAGSKGGGAAVKSAGSRGPNVSVPTGTAAQVRVLRMAAGASESIGLRRAQCCTADVEADAWPVLCSAMRCGAVQRRNGSGGG